MPGAVPTGQAHAALATEEAQLAKLVIAEGRPHIRSEGLTEFAQALARALASRVIADSDKAGVTRIIPIGDGKIGCARSRQKILQQVILLERLSLPDEAPPHRKHPSQQRIGYTPQFIVIAARLFGRAGVVDVAYNCEPEGFTHAWSVS